MTAPIAHGYADFNRSSAQSDVIVVQDSSHTSSVTVDYGVIPITNAPFLFVSAFTTTGHVRVSLAFCADAAGTQVIQVFHAAVRQGDSYIQNIPVLGPFVHIFVSPGSVTPFTYGLTVSVAPQLAGPSAYQLEDAFVSQDNVAVGAGLTVTVECPVVMAGPAYWNAFCGAATWFAKVIAIDEFGVTQTIDVVTQQYAVGVPRAIYLPSKHIRFTMSNSSGAGSTFNMFGSRLWYDHG